MRIILCSGKGGVGKTSVAAATGYKAMSLGYRTLVMSLDMAHSLADSFDLDRALLDQNHGELIKINDKLWIQELDVQREVERNWGEVYQYISTLFNVTGLDEVLAEELAILPGMEEVCALLYINDYQRKKMFDVIVLDCAPTGESIRFISMPSALEWYMRKIFTLERNLARVVRPVVKTVTNIPVPEDSYFQALERLFHRLEGVEKLLLDPHVTTVRLVTNPEKMILKETQRAYMYFCLYGLTVDAVIINRIIPDAVQDRYFANWKKTQHHYVDRIEEYFYPLPIFKVNLFTDEIVGPRRIAALADAMFRDRDPIEVYYSEQPCKYLKKDGVYKLTLALPFARKDDVDLHVSGDELIVRIGSFKRHIPLPRALMNSQPSSAKMEGGALVLTFGEKINGQKAARSDKEKKTGAR